MAMTTLMPTTNSTSTITTTSTSGSSIDSCHLARIISSAPVVTKAVTKATSSAMKLSNHRRSVRQSLLSPSLHKGGSTSSSSRSSKGQRRRSLKFSAKDFITKFDGDFQTQYKVGPWLGQGAYGGVYLCTHLETNEERAVKIIPKSTDELQNDTVMREFEVLKELDHPNALKIYTLLQDDDKFYIVTDLIRGGELFDLLEQPFTEDEVRTLLKSLLGCLNYCHSQNVVHRDLKPENILLKNDKRDFSQISVIDFGLAQFFEHDASTFKDAAGSSYYMAPQVIEGHYTAKCDVWSCGVIAFVCLGGYAPYCGEDDEDTAQIILDSDQEGVVYFDDPLWDQFSDEALDFIAYLMAYKEEDRPTAEEALQHEWLNVMSSQTLAEHSEKRDSARESLEHLKAFSSDDSKLKQCTYSLISSQILCKEEKEAFDEIFRALDVNSDGIICQEDMKIIYKRYYKTEFSDKDLMAIIYQVNLSGSGAITYSEFIIASMLEKDLVSDHNLEMAFHILDKDQSGYLTFHSLKEMLDVGDNMEDYVNERIIAPADLDGDGKISIEDFKALFVEREPTPPPPPTRLMRGRSRELSNGIFPRRRSLQARKGDGGLGLGGEGGSNKSKRRSTMRMSFRGSVRGSMHLRDEQVGLEADSLASSGGVSFAGNSFADSSGVLHSSVGSEEPTFRNLLNIFETISQKNNTANGSSHAIPSLFQIDKRIDE